MGKWIAEFDLEDGDVMPEHVDLKYRGVRLDFHCRPMWIRISDRLPEEMGTYMTTIDYGKHGLAIGQRYYYGNGLGWDDDCVIAWMPLPKPCEPKTGHWIRVDKTKVKCSECDITHFIAQYPMGETKFCPNCGAQMESDDIKPNDEWMQERVWDDVYETEHVIDGEWKGAIV